MDQIGCETIEHVLISHHHYDHIGGIPSIQSVFDKVRIHQDMEEGTEFKVDGETIKVIATPGHTEVCFNCSFNLKGPQVFSIGNRESDFVCRLYTWSRHCSVHQSIGLYEKSDQVEGHLCSSTSHKDISWTRSHHL